MIVKREESDLGFTTVYLFPTEEYLRWRSGHTLHCGEFSVSDGDFGPPRVSIRLLSFDGTPDELRAYAEGLAIVAAEAEKLQAEKTQRFAAIMANRVAK